MTLFKRALILSLIICFSGYFYFKPSPSVTNINSYIAEKNLDSDKTKSIPPQVRATLLRKEIESGISKAAIKPIVKCNNDWANPSAEEALKNEYHEYRDVINNSKHDDDKFALLLQSEEKDPNIFSLKMLSVHKALIYDKKLMACTQNFNPSYCNESLYQQAKYVDKDNGYLWHLIANIHFLQNNIPEAIHAINIANKKPQFNDYFYETISFIEQNIQLNNHRLKTVG